MSLESNTLETAATAAPEPQASAGAAPVWLMVLLFVLLFWGAVYFDHNGGWFEPAVYVPYVSVPDLQAYEPRGAGSSLERGKAVYESICALCHNTDGTGKPNQAPPFAGSDWAVGSPARMIRIPLSGLSGPIKVKDTEWSLSMPAMGAALPDDDLAAVLTYIRQSWGNKGSAVTAEQVKAVRAEIGNRSQPWTVDQLNAIP
jgi:mono/diheme cytochrome c family protein